MAKKQKKPIDLSMGGVLPRRLKPITTVKVPTLTRPQTSRKTDETQKNDPKPAKKKAPRGFSLVQTLDFARKNMFYLLVPAWILGLYLFAINDFPPPLAGDNVQASNFQHVAGINSIDFLPVKLSLVTLAKLNITGQLGLRLISVAVVFLSLFCFYKLVASWINKRASVLSVLLYSSTGWMLFQARQDTVSTMMFALVPVFLYFGVLAAETESVVLQILCGIILAQLIFVPGALWFIILGIIIGAAYEGKDIDIPSLTPSIVSFLAVTAAYAAGIISFISLERKTELLRLAGVFSGHFPGLNTIKENLVHLPAQLFYSGLEDNSLWFHGTPIIDYVSLVFLVTGLAYLIKSHGSYRISRVVIGSFLILSLILIAVNGITAVSIMMPVIYIALAVGLAYIIDQWLVIFPNNPLARMFGIAVICISVFLVCGYQVERYFIGWPRTDAYHQIYKG